MEDQNLPDKTTDEFVTEMLNKDPIFPAAIGLVPVIGGPLATLFTSKWAKISQERTEMLYKYLAERLRVLDEETIKKDYPHTDEGADLFVKATEISAKNRSKEKRKLIAGILAGATTTDSAQGEYSPEEYLNLIADLTDKEWQIAHTIYKRHHRNFPRELEPNNRAATWVLVNQKLIELHNIDADALPLYLNRLHLAGLLDLHYVTTPGNSMPTYWVSSAFRNLMSFLDLDDSDPK